MRNGLAHLTSRNQVRTTDDRSGLKLRPLFHRRGRELDFLNFWHALRGERKRHIESAFFSDERELTPQLIFGLNRPDRLYLSDPRELGVGVLPPIAQCAVQEKIVRDNSAAEFRVPGLDQSRDLLLTFQKDRWRPRDPWREI